MRIHINNHSCAEWTPGSRFINIYPFADPEELDFPHGYIFLGSDTTQLMALEAVLNHAMDLAIAKHPAGKGLDNALAALVKK